MHNIPPLEIVSWLLCSKYIKLTYFVTEYSKEHIDVETKDHMHVGDGPRAPEVPKPLLMAVWESRNEASVEVLISLGASTETLYSKSGPKAEAEPLFFHVSLIAI